MSCCNNTDKIIITRGASPRIPESNINHTSKPANKLIAYCTTAVGTNPATKCTTNELYCCTMNGTIQPPKPLISPHVPPPSTACGPPLLSIYGTVDKLYCYTHPKPYAPPSLTHLRYSWYASTLNVLRSTLTSKTGLLLLLGAEVEAGPGAEAAGGPALLPPWPPQLCSKERAGGGGGVGERL